jgi:hypothetical protein
LELAQDKACCLGFQNSLASVYEKDADMIKQYMRKSPKFEAIQWDGTNLDELKRFTNADGCNMLVDDFVLNRPMRVNDYILKISDDVFCVIKPEAFEQEYTVIAK